MDHAGVSLNSRQKTFVIPSEARNLLFADGACAAVKESGFLLVATLLVD
jgi:hypothetical protein